MPRRAKASNFVGRGDSLSHPPARSHGRVRFRWPPAKRRPQSAASTRCLLEQGDRRPAEEGNLLPDRVSVGGAASRWLGLLNEPFPVA